MAPGRRGEIGATGNVGGLVFGCEGVTDRAIYERILSQQSA
jgi:hypothetical protein